MLDRKPARIDPRIAWFADVRSVLSPMSGVTGRAFRDLCRQYGMQLGFCEYASAAGLSYDSEATWRLTDTDGEEGRVTKGQSSPTSPLTMKSKTAPYAYLEDPLNPMLMFLAYNASFCARGFSGKPKDLKEMFVQAIRHKGFAVVHIFSPCVSMNKEITFKTMQEIVQPLPEDHDPADRLKAMEYAMDQTRFYTGVFHKQERTTMGQRVEELRERAGTYQDINELLRQYM